MLLSISSDYNEIQSAFTSSSVRHQTATVDNPVTSRDLSNKAVAAKCPDESQKHWNGCRWYGTEMARYR